MPSVLQIRDAQSALRTMGFYHGPVDGLDGPYTRRAVERFQDEHMRKDNGKFPRWVTYGELTDSTMGKINSMLAHYEYVPPTPVTDLEMEDARVALLRTQRLLNSWGPSP